MKKSLRLSPAMLNLYKMGVQTTGCYEDGFYYIEENILSNQYDELEAFKNWVVENNKTFGHNVREIYNEFRANRAMAKAKKTSKESWKKINDKSNKPEAKSKTNSKYDYPADVNTPELKKKYRAEQRKLAKGK